MVLNFVFLAVSETVMGSWAHMRMKRAFFWWVIVCMSHCCANLPLLSCPFPEERIYWGGLPTPACPLLDAVIGISLLMAAHDFRRVQGWAVPCCCGPSGLGLEESWGPGPCGEPAGVLVCLAVSDPGRFGGPLSGFTFFPASGNNPFAPNKSLKLLPLFYENECQESAGCLVAIFELPEL